MSQQQNLINDLMLTARAAYKVWQDLGELPITYNKLIVDAFNTYEMHIGIIFALRGIPDNEYNYKALETEILAIDYDNTKMILKY